MFKNRKLEVRLVKDNDRKLETMSNEAQLSLTPAEYTALAEDAIVRLGKKLIIGAIVTITAVAVVTVLANAADTALQNAIDSE